MKTSNKILAIVAGLILLAGLASLIIVRIVVGQAVKESGAKVEARSFQASDIVSRDYDIEDFEQVKFVGGWKVQLWQGQDHEVILEFPEELEDRIVVEKRGSTLVLDTSTIFDLEGHAFVARLRMPALTAVESAGGITAEMTGFRGEHLQIHATGGSQIRARDCRYTDLKIDTTGGVDANFRDMPVRNADIESSGAINLVLTMDGGRLSGKISGVANVEYYGRVSENSLSASGVSNIQHKGD